MVLFEMEINCKVCNEQIPEERIEALPGTTTCVKCSTFKSSHDPNVVCAKASAGGRNGFAAND